MNSLLLFTIFATSVMADDLLSKLVSDVKANPQEYLSYIQTATASIPEDLTPLALQVRTYTLRQQPEKRNSGVCYGVAMVQQQIVG